MKRKAGEFDWNAVWIDSADGNAVPLSPSKSRGNLSAPHYESIVCDDVKGVTVVVGNLERALERWIAEADFVFCCFAWFTNFRILDAMASLKHGCQVVVQKEDFLRPDRNHTAASHKILREKYGRLKCRFPRFVLPSIASSLSVCYDDRVEGVRCAGVSNSDRRRAAPRMHHKFAVACKCEIVEPSFNNDFKADFFPYSVWTGSFNPTSNGTRSRENAVIIESKLAASGYVDEWAKVFAVSEPLDWETEWSQPEWRIGT